MANTDPQVQFKLDLPTLDRLRDALLRDYEALSTAAARIQFASESAQQQQPAKSALKNALHAQAMDISAKHFSTQTLLRHFSVNDALIKAAETRAEEAAKQ